MNGPKWKQMPHTKMQSFSHKKAAFCGASLFIFDSLYFVEALVLKWLFVRQLENFFCWAVSMPLLSIPPDLHALNSKNCSKKLDIGGAGEWHFLGFLGQKTNTWEYTFLRFKTRISYWDSNTAAGGELNENMNNGADTGDDPLLIFFEENLKWLQRRTDELKTERAMQKNKFKYESNHFSFIYLSYLNFGHS